MPTTKQKEVTKKSTRAPAAKIPKQSSGKIMSAKSSAPAKSSAAKSGAAKPSVAKPSMPAKPGAAKTSAAKPSMPAKSRAAKPSSAKPSAAKPSAAKPSAAKSGIGKSSVSARSKLPDNVFAFPKERKEPLTDAKHVRDAIARFDQVEGTTDAEKDAAWKRIIKSAKKFDIKVRESSWRELGHSSKNGRSKSPSSKKKTAPSIKVSSVKK